MFNGVIRHLARFINYKDNRLTLNFFDLNDEQINDIKLGDSIACNGTCLTVVDIKNHEISFDLAPETILQTNLTLLKSQDILNVEFPMRVGDKIDGHIVYGHIYGKAKIIKIDENNIFTFEAEEGVFKYLDYKAPIAIDGISLTISNIDRAKRHFTVNVIPFTLQHTNLSYAKLGKLVNIEPDVLAVYACSVARLSY